MSLRRHASAGFTLIEMLVALTVLGMLMVALTQGARMGLQLWSAQRSRIAATAELDAATRTLRGILTKIPLQPAALATPMSLGFDGQSARLSLVGELPTGVGARRLVDMTIQLRAGTVLLSWRPHRHELTQAPEPAAVDSELVRGVAGLELAYWGSAAPDAPASWLTQWGGPALPALVRVRVGFAHGDDRHWPDLIAAPQLWRPES